MSKTTLIACDELEPLLRAQPAAVRVFDCSFDLADAAAGRRMFEAAHIPGAAYVHLDDDLSGAKTGSNGRHPLPPIERLLGRLALLGVGDDTQVIAYDRSGGMYAARLWWLLRWTGHAAVAVLDGGLQAWQAAGLALESGEADTPEPQRLSHRPSLVNLVGIDAVRANLVNGERIVVDARAADRFRGENETLDAIGGHIPGARNRPFKSNLDAEGRFKPAAQLRVEFDAVTAGFGVGQVIHQCGSGVTA